jgi:diguanylate cyclase (GGDEF)-like protein
LTGLANRRLFEDRLSQAIAKYHRYGTMFGLLYLDLDHFKMINDRFGHEAGDIVLMETAERIRSCCKRDVDTICRQGGDEFCIIISNCKERKYLEKIAEKLLETVSLPILVGATDISVTTSIGIGMFPSDGATSKSIKAAADAAMYSAKQLGRNTHNFFDARTLTM